MKESGQLVSRVEHKPHLSVVVVVYNMPREAPRTLLSLSASYQRHIDADDYEVIVVDNGSNPPFDAREIDKLAGNFRLIRLDPAPPSPARAVNCGLAEARGEIVGVMIDGARIVTPGLLHFARHGAGLYDRAIVATLGWYLGHDLQSWAMRAGYDQMIEDDLLASIEWPADGYRLFEIATMDEASLDGWFAPIGETNALFMRRDLWNELGGLDERFNVPGGGLANGDIFRRAGNLPGAELVILLGEATFHQIHGGAATNAPVEDFPDLLAKWNEQYETIRGCSFSYPNLKGPPTLLGTLPRPALARFVRAAVEPVNVSLREHPLGPHFARESWSLAPFTQPKNPRIAALVDLARSEFQAQRYESAAAVSRLVRARAPDEPEPQRILSLIGSRLSVRGPALDQRAAYHCALGEAYRLLGESVGEDSKGGRSMTADTSLNGT